jgi:hypothetical protein
MNVADHVIHTKDLVSVCISRRRHRALEVTSGHRHTLAIDEVTPRHARRRKALALEGLVTLHRRRKALALEGLVTLRRRRKALALEGLVTLRRRKALLLHRHGDNQYQGHQEQCRCWTKLPPSSTSSQIQTPNIKKQGLCCRGFTMIKRPSMSFETSGHR